MIVLSGLKHKECPTGDALLEMKYLGTIIFLKTLQQGINAKMLNKTA